MAARLRVHRQRHHVRQRAINSRLDALEFPRGVRAVAPVARDFLAQTSEFFARGRQRFCRRRAVEFQRRFRRGRQILIHRRERRRHRALPLPVAIRQRRNRFRQFLHVERACGFLSLFNDQRRRAAEERIAEERRRSLRAVLGVPFHSHFHVALSPQRRHVIHRQRHAARRGVRIGGAEAEASRTQFQRDFPRRESLRNLLREFCGIGRIRDGLRRQDAARLMLSVSEMYAAPSVDHHIRPVHANHPHHVAQWNLIAPYLHRPVGAF